MNGQLERLLVTLGVLASFTILDALGKMSATLMTIYGPLMGAIAVAWFQAHISALSQVAKSDNAPASGSTAASTAPHAG